MKKKPSKTRIYKIHKHIIENPNITRDHINVDICGRTDRQMNSRIYGELLHDGYVINKKHGKKRGYQVTHNGITEMLNHLEFSNSWEKRTSESRRNAFKKEISPLHRKILDFIEQQNMTKSKFIEVFGHKTYYNELVELIVVGWVNSVNDVLSLNILYENEIRTLEMIGDVNIQKDEYLENLYEGFEPWLEIEEMIKVLSKLIKTKRYTNRDTRIVEALSILVDRCEHSDKEYATKVRSDEFPISRNEEYEKIELTESALDLLKIIKKDYVSEAKNLSKKYSLKDCNEMSNVIDRLCQSRLQKRLFL